MTDEIYTVEKCRRKARQCWDLAGCARVDGDTADEKRWTSEARKWEKRLGQLVRNAAGQAGNGAGGKDTFAGDGPDLNEEGDQ